MYAFVFLSTISIDVCTRKNKKSPESYTPGQILTSYVYACIYQIADSWTIALYMLVTERYKREHSGILSL